MEGYQPKICVRVFTRKGKDMIRLKDGRWCDILSETDIGVTVRAPKLMLNPVSIEGMSSWIESGETYDFDILKQHIEDLRARTARK